MVLQNLYDAVIDGNNLYDFPLPSLAIAAGAKRIYIRPGTYNESKTISVPQGTTITGAQVDSTIIDFGGNNASLVSDSGYGTSVTNGTIAVTQGSATVVGTGTTFLTSLVTATGKYIVIDKNSYIISSITNDTTLVLAYPFRGRTRSGLSYKALAMYSGLEVLNLTIRNSTSVGLRLSGNRRVRVSNVVIRNCATNMVMQDCIESVVKSLNSSQSTVAGLSLISVDSSNFKDLFLLNNVSDGLVVTGDCSGLRLRSVDAANNGANGVNLNATQLSNFGLTGGTFFDNVANGFLCNANASNVTLAFTDAESNGDTGATFAGNNGTFSGCTFSFNVNVGLDVPGNDCVVQGCNGTGGANQPIGVRFSGMRGVMTGSSFTNNGTNSVNLTATAQMVLVATSNLSGAGDTQIQDDSYASYTSLNML